MRQACVTPTASALTLDTPSAHAAHPKKGGGQARKGRPYMVKTGKAGGGYAGGRETQAGVRLAGATPTASVQILDMPSAPAAHPAREGHTQAGSNRPVRTIVLAQQAVHMYTPHHWPRSEHAAPAPTCDRVIPPPPHAAAVPTTTSHHTSLPPPPPPTHTHVRNTPWYAQHTTSTSSGSGTPAAECPFVPTLCDPHLPQPADPYTTHIAKASTCQCPPPVLTSGGSTSPVAVSPVLLRLGQCVFVGGGRFKHVCPRLVT